MYRSSGLVLSLALSLLGSAACGYRPLHATMAEPLAVAGARAPFADASIETELLAGARAELSRAGVLRAGQDHPRLVVEALRLEDEPAGLARHGSGPSARAIRLRLAARAWIERHPGSTEGETGEVVVETFVAAEDRALAESWREQHAVRAAARRLGEELARRILGLPARPAPGRVGRMVGNL